MIAVITFLKTSFIQNAQKTNTLLDFNSAVLPRFILCIILKQKSKPLHPPVGPHVAIVTSPSPFTYFTTTVLNRLNYCILAAGQHVAIVTSHSLFIFLQKF
jgi:hypothetical protein